MLEYELITKETFLCDYKIILLKIEVPSDRYFSCSKVFCSKVKLTIVHYSIFKEIFIRVHPFLHLNKYIKIH